MDRFIVKAATLTQIATMYLKSNMDRFIAECELIIPYCGNYLKSNMDRFIADILAITKSRIEIFKIQYG